VYYFTLGLAHVCAMSSTVSNPVLYGWLNTNLRKEFIKVKKGLRKSEGGGGSKARKREENTVDSIRFIKVKSIIDQSSNCNTLLTLSFIIVYCFQLISWPAVENGRKRHRSPSPLPPPTRVRKG
jgi:hypothetical protein